VKKAKKWSCKVCGEKQSYLKVYGQGSGKDCRIHVQKLNALSGGLQRDAEDQLGDQAHFSSDDEFEQIWGGGGGRGGGGGGGRSNLSLVDESRPGQWRREAATRLSQDQDCGSGSRSSARFSMENATAHSATFERARPGTWSCPKDHHPTGNGSNDLSHNGGDVWREENLTMTTTTTSKIDDQKGRGSRWNKFLEEKPESNVVKNVRGAKENESSSGKTECSQPPWKRARLNNDDDVPRGVPVREQFGVRLLGQRTTLGYTTERDRDPSRWNEDESLFGYPKETQESKKEVYEKTAQGGDGVSTSGSPSAMTSREKSDLFAGMTDDDWNEMLDDL